MGCRRCSVGKGYTADRNCYIADIEGYIEEAVVHMDYSCHMDCAEQADMGCIDLVDIDYNVVVGEAGMIHSFDSFAVRSSST